MSNGKLTAKKINKNTGRSGYHIINDQPTDHPAVQSFVKKLCDNPKNPRWYWTYFFKSLSWTLYRQINAAAEIEIKGTFYRARCFEVDRVAPSSDEFGPPPLEMQKDGRYTLNEKKVLYLSRTPETAAMEIGTNLTKPRIFIQRFDLSITGEKVISLSQDLEDKCPHLHYLLLNSEYLPEEGSFVPHPYRATQFLAFLCHWRGVHAIEYPSIRAGYGDNPDAINLVLFDRALDLALKQTNDPPFELG
ncbi:MAG: RES family NAD+ phosphorylase [Candidatus Dadabacteria bacterium]|nr:RES family NAD+ phosphorylase [Candidatus Dadabacteria bacterium]